MAILGLKQTDLTARVFHNVIDSCMSFFDKILKVSSQSTSLDLQHNSPK